MASAFQVLPSVNWTVVNGAHNPCGQWHVKEMLNWLLLLFRTMA